MVNHCSITMVKPCLTIVKTNHASPILQKCQNHGRAWFNHGIPWYSMVLQLWFSMVKHGYTHIISQGDWQTLDKAIPVCHYASQATQKIKIYKWKCTGNKTTHGESSSFCSSVIPWYLRYSWHQVTLFLKFRTLIPNWKAIEAKRHLGIVLGVTRLSVRLSRFPFCQRHNVQWRVLFEYLAEMKIWKLKVVLDS